MAKVVLPMLVEQVDEMNTMQIRGDSAGCLEVYITGKNVIGGRIHFHLGPSDAEAFVKAVTKQRKKVKK